MCVLHLKIIIMENYIYMFFLADSGSQFYGSTGSLETYRADNYPFWCCFTIGMGSFFLCV